MHELNFGMSLTASDFQGSLPYSGGDSTASSAAFRWSYNPNGTGGVTFERVGKFIRVEAANGRLTTVGNFNECTRRGCATIRTGLINYAVRIDSAQIEDVNNYLFYGIIEGAEFNRT